MVLSYNGSPMPMTSSGLFGYDLLTIVVGRRPRKAALFFLHFLKLTISDNY